MVPWMLSLNHLVSSLKALIFISFHLIVIKFSQHCFKFSLTSFLSQSPFLNLQAPYWWIVNYPEQINLSTFFLSLLWHYISLLILVLSWDFVVLSSIAMVLTYRMCVIYVWSYNFAIRSFAIWVLKILL